MENQLITVSHFYQMAKIHKFMKQVSSRLRMDLAQYRELAGFTQFGADVDSSTRRVLEAGRRMMAALRQKRYTPLPDWQETLLIFAVSEGLAAGVTPDSMEDYALRLTETFVKDCPDMIRLLSSGKKLTDEEKRSLRDAVSRCAGTATEMKYGTSEVA